MNNFNAQIFGDGGHWAETEVLGDVALVKVRASVATLATIAAAAGFQRIPNHWQLTDRLGDLTVAQRNAILNKLLSLGYTQAEIDAALPKNWQNVTLGQVLRFAATRRRKPRYDPVSDTIFCDGVVVTPRSIQSVDEEVT